MFTFLRALAVLLLLPGFAFAQFSLSGKVIEAENAQLLVGASVHLMPVNQAAQTNAAGQFRFADLPAGNYLLKVSYLGFETVSQAVVLSADKQLDLALPKAYYLTGEVVVNATRANEKTASTYTNVSKEEIEERNFGQDLPYLLQQTPSLVVNSDAGAGVGYTGLRIRGSDITRINVTINGIPVNEAESHGVFFVDIPDIASSVENIQIQRGVGTSTNGASAFGASMNIKTLDLNPKAYAEATNGYGSYNTWRHTLKFGTGLIDGKFAFDGRLSKTTSDGFIDRAFSDLKSYYFSGGYYGKKTMVKFITFSGKEQTYQAWNGIPEARLNGNPEEMKAYAIRNGLTPQETGNLLNSGSRTYNSFTYQNQTDNYQQDYYQLHFNRELNRKWNLNAALHYTRGGGYYEEFKYADDYYGKGYFSTYNLPNVIVGSDTVANSDLVRRLWLKTDLYGATYSAVYNNEKNLRLTVGGSVMGYQGLHYDELIWAKIFPGETLPHRYHEDKATKHDVNFYAKAEYSLNDKLSFFGDIQNRSVGYTFVGFNKNLESANQTVNYNFVNPKAGVTYAFLPGQAFYASYAVSNREPVRDDFKDSSPTSRPKPENLQDYEAGYRLSCNEAALFNRPLTYFVNANAYYMQYKNQLVLTGKVNDVGAYTRTNVDDSYRQGVEIAAGAELGKKLSLNLALNFSRNKINNFTEFLDDYDNGGQVENHYKQTDIAFSPDKVISAEVGYVPVKGLKASFVHRVVGSQFLDNTSNEARMLNGYNVSDIRIRYAIHPVNFVKAIEFGAQVNNVFSSVYEANGYTFSYLYGGMTTENFYYPQAPRNFMVSVGIKF